MSRSFWLVLSAGFTFLAVGLLPAEPVPKSPSLEESLVKARVDGKYRMLLHQIKSPDDEKEHGAFKDLGFQTRPQYAGQKDLSPGFWVYDSPYWYVWREQASAGRARRNWGPEQMIGPPDTWPRAGDQGTAWASLTEDGQDEWVMVEYAEAVQPSAVLVFETYNPGAVSRVLVYKLDGEEVEVWKGTDPTPVGSGLGISVIPFRTAFKTNRVKIELRSKEVGGWNEIDTVGLRAGGKVHWPIAANASTTYASLTPEPAPPVVDVDGQKLDALEKDVRDIKERLRKLEERIKKRKMK